MPLLSNAIDAVNTIRDASARYGVGISPLVRRFLHLYRKRQFSAYEIRFNDLLNPRISDQGLDCYMSKEEMLAFDERHVLKSYLCVTSDKAVFYSICMAAGIPIPRLLAVFDQPSGWLPDGRMLHSRSEWCGFLRSLPQDFVVKPALGLLGKGVTGFHREGDAFVDHQGGRRTAEELYDFLGREGELNLFTTGYAHHSLNLPQPSHKTIIQERLYTHPEVAELTGSATVCACRLFTRTDRAGNFQLLGSGFRLAGGKAFVDNFDQGAAGNLWCSVDPDSGRILDALGKPPGSKRLELATKHPAAGRDVIGFRIPHWHRAVELGRHLASVFRPQPVITWDVGITRDGPVALEGNLGGNLLPAPLNVPVRPLLTET